MVKLTFAVVFIDPINTLSIVPARVAKTFIHIVLTTHSSRTRWAVTLESILTHFTSSTIEARVVLTFVDLWLAKMTSETGIALTTIRVDAIFKSNEKFKNKFHIIIHKCQKAKYEMYILSYLGLTNANTIVTRISHTVVNICFTVFS